MCCRRPQLSCLHLLDMFQEEQAKLVTSFPRILTVDVEAGLLPVLMYMQACGQLQRNLHAFPSREAVGTPTSSTDEPA